MNQCAKPEARPKEWAERSSMAAVVARLTPKPPHVDPRQLDIFESRDVQPDLFKDGDVRE